MNTLFNDAKRINILITLEEQPKKFVELKKTLGLASNLLSYNLKILLREKLIQKNALSFSLTEKGKYLMPYIYKHNDASLIPMPCVAVIVRKNECVLIRKKTKEPEKGKNIFIGGKINLGEDLFCAARRHAREKTGIEITNLKLICINNYIARAKENTAHYITFFITAEPIGKPKDATWHHVNKITGTLFPDNAYVLEHMLHNSHPVLLNSTYDAEKNKFIVVNTH